MKNIYNDDNKKNIYNDDNKKNIYNDDNKENIYNDDVKESYVEHINHNIDICKNNKKNKKEKRLCLSFLSSSSEEEALKSYFDKCLYKIIKRRTRTCDNNLCCGLLYIPYSYIVVLLNRKIENLTYACTYLRIPSDTDIYYNNKKNTNT
ncbi:ubiquitin-conjugating enzyme [Plasmodium falciparum RAJ116]|uniref:Ubiquitin-conjugating enzyme n=1 Tax=Plasmodium falciparum RAJ116 TaxID=580058 RepID=A0A0L0CUY2_PLAFA|nr:ubiquitin-conjugating enzyme [Plasmodium falciparum RAJ116]